MSDHAPARDLLRRWESGDEAAADMLYRRYAQRLCALADAKIGARLRRREGPEDAVQSAFRTFFRRAADGQFRVDHSGAIWNLLVMITLNKIRRKAEYHHAQKRDIAAEVSLNNPAVSPLVVAHDPTPEEAALLHDCLECLLADLKPPEPQIVRLCLQGYSTSEIADRVGSTRWTVRRVLDRVGHLFQRKLAED